MISFVSADIQDGPVDGGVAGESAVCDLGKGWTDKSRRGVWAGDRREERGAGQRTPGRTQDSHPTVREVRVEGSDWSTL